MKRKKNFFKKKFYVWGKSRSWWKAAKPGTLSLYSLPHCDGMRITCVWLWTEPGDARCFYISAYPQDDLKRTKTTTCWPYDNSCGIYCEFLLVRQFYRHINIITIIAARLCSARTSKKSRMWRHGPQDVTIALKKTSKYKRLRHWLRKSNLDLILQLHLSLLFLVSFTQHTWMSETCIN